MTPTNDNKIYVGDIHVDLPNDEFKMPTRPMVSDMALKMAAEFERKFFNFGIAHKAAIIYVVQWTHVENGNIWCTDSLFFDNKEEAMASAKEHGVNFTEHDMRNLLDMSDHDFTELMLSNPSKNSNLAFEYRRRLKQKTIYLPLQKKWFDMIKSGEKKEEYREIKGKYIDQFCELLNVHEPNKSNDFCIGYHLKWPETYDKVVFTLGYPKKGVAGRRLEFNNPKVRIGTGKPEWGAKPDKRYFVITWDAE